MRKINPFLRAALLLFVLVFITGGVFMATGTTAKYVAQGAGNAEARAAKFSFLIGSDKIVSGSYTAKAKGADGKYWSGASASGYWEQVVTSLGVNSVQEFEIPMFANAYLDPTGASTTVQGAGSDVVVAPGVGAGGAGLPVPARAATRISTARTAAARR